MTKSLKEPKMQISVCSTCGRACVLLHVGNGKWQKRDRRNDKLIFHACKRSNPEASVDADVSMEAAL